MNLDLRHDDDEISFLDAEFLDGVLVVYSFALEYYFE